MSNILTSDLFRNFMGGFALGAVALFALQPRDADASPPAATVVQEAALENPDS